MIEEPQSKLRFFTGLRFWFYKTRFWFFNSSFWFINTRFWFCFDFLVEIKSKPKRKINILVLPVQSSNGVEYFEGPAAPYHEIQRWIFECGLITSFFNKVNILHVLGCFKTFVGKMPAASLYLQLQYWNFECSLIFWLCYHLEKLMS